MSGRTTSSGSGESGLDEKLSKSNLKSAPDAVRRDHLYREIPLSKAWSNPKNSAKKKRPKTSRKLSEIYAERLYYFPVNEKYPVLGVKQKDSLDFTTGPVGHRVYKPTRAIDGFQFPKIESTLSYNPLLDPNLVRFFMLKGVQKQVKDMGLVNKDGHVLCTIKQFNEFRRQVYQDGLLQKKAKDREVIIPDNYEILCEGSPEEVRKLLESEGENQKKPTKQDIIRYNLRKQKEAKEAKLKLREEARERRQLNLQLRQEKELLSRRCKAVHYTDKIKMTKAQREKKEAERLDKIRAKMDAKENASIGQTFENYTEFKMSKNEANVVAARRTLHATFSKYLA